MIGNDRLRDAEESEESFYKQVTVKAKTSLTRKNQQRSRERHLS